MRLKRALAMGMAGIFLATSLPVLPASAAMNTAQLVDGGGLPADTHTMRRGNQQLLGELPSLQQQATAAPKPPAKRISKKEKSTTHGRHPNGGLLGMLARKVFFFLPDDKNEQQQETAALKNTPDQSMLETANAAVEKMESAAEVKNVPVEAPRAIHSENAFQARMEETLALANKVVGNQAQPAAAKVTQQQIVAHEMTEEVINFAGVGEAALPEAMTSVPTKMATPTQIAAATPAPRLDSVKESPLMGEGDVKVLRSGISTTMNEIDLTMGKAVVLNLSQPAARVSISDPAIANAVILSPTQIQLVGLQVGVANLLLWGDADDTNHTVLDISVHRDVSVLVRQLKFVDPGIQIVPLAAEDTVILTGQAESREASQLAVEMARAFFRDGGAAGVRSSSAPGTALPGSSPNVINLVKVKGEPSTKLDLVRQKLQEIDPGINLDIVPARDGSERVILTGKVKTADVVSKAVNLASVFYGEPGMRVLTGPGGNAVRDGGGNSNFQGDSFNGNADINVLQGSIITDSSGNVISMLDVAFRPQIRCSIQFLEISKTGLESLGNVVTGMGGAFGVTSRSGIQSGAPGRPIATVDSADSGHAFAAASNRNTIGAARNALTTANAFENTLLDGVTQAFSINEQIAVAIQALEENRKARSLAEPTMTLLSGEKASFLAGGEVPIAVTSANGQVSVDYHEFGIRLNLIGTVTEDGRIHMQVAPEVSSIDPAINSGGFPGFRTRRMQTTLELDNNQSFLLAGLFSQDDVYSTSAFPWLGSLPVVGSFFRNKWNSKANSELVVIIKPQVIEGPFGQ